MANAPPEFCHYCGTALEHVDPPMIHRCGSCEDYVFYNPVPGGSTAVVDGDSVLLVEDFRDEGTWKLPAGRIECGESAREGVARELREETGLTVDPDDLTYFADNAGEPVSDQYMVNVDFAVPRERTTGPLEAGSDATDARFFTPAEFEASDHTLRASFVDRFDTDSLERVLEEAQAALDSR